MNELSRHMALYKCPITTVVHTHVSALVHRRAGAVAAVARYLLAALSSTEEQVTAGEAESVSTASRHLPNS